LVQTIQRSVPALTVCSQNRYDPRNAVDDPTFLTNRYLNMHELARHIIHTSEVLEVAINTLRKMITHHEESFQVGLQDTHPSDCCEMLDDATTQSEALAASRKIHKVNVLAPGDLPADTQNRTNTRLEVTLMASAEKIRTGIQLYTCMLESLELRSNAFEKRLQNEIKLVSLLTRFLKQLV
jgi:hypothetical protein